MAATESGTVAVLAEKPSVARDIARVLGASSKGDGYLHGNGYVVTWAIGHLAALAQPHEINPHWRSGGATCFPCCPKQWPLVVYEKTKDQFESRPKRILNSPEVSRVVCATDAGREGELIFRYIYEAAHCDKPVSRLWISSLTPDAIRAASTLCARRPIRWLADAARGRSRADWLVGMNLSRAYSLAYDEELSVGRVQTPTLAMVVERELAIRRFVPEDYIEVLATFRPTEQPEVEHRTRARGFANAARRTRATRNRCNRPCACRPTAKKRSRSPPARAPGRRPSNRIEAQTQRMPPPPLYDLTELQRHANRLFGFSAQKTLDTAQALYERHKLISYPRTDSRHLSQDVARTLPRIVDGDRGAVSRAPRARHRRASARAPLRGRCEGHRSPRHHSDRHARPDRRPCRRTSARSTIWSAAASSAPGTTTTSGPSPP